MAVVSLKPLHKEAQDKMAECLEVLFVFFFSRNENNLELLKE